MSKPVILTGLRANNDLHIGNYFGALLPMIDMARSKTDEYQINLFVPDLHSFTTPIDHSRLQANIMHNLRLFVAAGLPLDHPDIHIYRQSYVSAHSELTWILDCFAGFGELNRMTQFKDKGRDIAKESINRLLKQKQYDTGLRGYLLEKYPELVQDDVVKEEVSVGLFNYPVLMTADILLYDATYVPVGDDQTQHLEFARDIAARMNNQFGELFVVPKPVNEQHAFFNKDQGLRIKDLQDPTKKMSKSDESSRGVIFLGDDPNEAAKKITSATTDSLGRIVFDLNTQPGIGNLLQLLALFDNRTLDAVVAEWEGKTSYGELKKVVADTARQFLQTFQARLRAVDEQLLLKKLATDEQTMNRVANQTLRRVQQAVGLRPQE